MFIVDGDTHVFRQDVEIGYGALGVGDPVVVKARLNTRNELVAREIKVRVNNAPDIRVSGRVDQVLPPDLTVAGRLVHTNSGTQIFGVGDPALAGGRPPGNQVTVTGPEGRTTPCWPPRSGSKPRTEASVGPAPLPRRRGSGAARRRAAGLLTCAP